MVLAPTSDTDMASQPGNAYVADSLQQQQCSGGDCGGCAYQAMHEVHSSMQKGNVHWKGLGSWHERGTPAAPLA